MAFKMLKILRLLLAVLMVIFPIIRKVATGGFRFIPLIYIVELILLTTLLVIHKIIQKASR